jgi:O-methyltransferase domain/Dimerisation domain
MLPPDHGGPTMPTSPMQYIYPGIIAAQAIHAAVQFNLPDLLASGPKSSAELAANCGAHAPTLERLLRALTSIEMFQRMPDGRYRNTPLTDVLRADHPQSLRAEGMFLPATFMWRPLGELAESVRTGETPFDKVFAQGFFTYLAEHSEDSAVFNRVMTQDIIWTTPALLKAYDFSRFKQIMDVGGGYGVLLSHILSATPKLEGVLFDQQQVVAGARDFLKGDVAARTKIVSGSFYDSVPEGSDAYLLRRIIHDWKDAEAVKILSNVRAAMKADGTLLLIEGLIDSETRPVGLMDLMDLMMLVLGGVERTVSEFEKLVKAAGFRLDRIIPAGTYSIIECKPV